MGAGVGGSGLGDGFGERSTEAFNINDPNTYPTESRVKDNNYFFYLRWVFDVSYWVFMIVILMGVISGKDFAFLMSFRADNRYVFGSESKKMLKPKPD